MKYSVTSVCDSIVRWSLYGALFLTPLFFLPLTLYPTDLNKQALLTALACIGFVALLVRAVATGKIEYAKSPIGGILGVLVVFLGVSAFFSPARHVALMGVTGGEVDTVVVFLTFTLIYFLAVHTLRDKESVASASTALLASASVMALLSLLQIVGVRIFPWGFARVVGFNSIGTTNALALYFGFMFIIAFAGAYQGMGLGKKMRIWYTVIAGALFVLIFLIGYWAAFLALIVALVVLVVLDGRVQGVKVSRRRNLVPIGLIVACTFMVAVGLGIVPVPLPRLNVPAEIAPSVSVSWRIVQATARESVRSFLLGSGPATYQYQYGKYRDVAFNQTVAWDIRFAQGFNAILTHLVSWGVVGTILFLLFLVASCIEAVRLARGRRLIDFRHVAFIVGGAFLVLTLFLYPQNFVVYFLVFVCAGAITAMQAEYKEVSCASFARSLGVMLAILAVSGVAYASGRRYVAGVQFGRGISVGRAAQNAEVAMPLLVAGSALDPKNDVYLQVLADAYLSRANSLASIAQSKASVPSPDVQAQITTDVGTAVAVAERAAQVNPANVTNWLSLARTYEAVMAIKPDSAQGAFAAYAVAANLEPNNPAIPVGLGLAHIAYADRLSKEKRAAEYQVAQGAFERALSLKSNYAPAYFALVQVFDRQGKSAEAVARAEQLRLLAPNDVGILFQLGVLHYQVGRMTQAQTALEGAVRVAPDYANALYLLGLTYDQAGNRANALLAFERVLKSNPDNKEVIAIIGNLRNSRPALSSGAQPRPVDAMPATSPLRPR